jgi:hypothetical protein
MEYLKEYEKIFTIINELKESVCYANKIDLLA